MRSQTKCICCLLLIYILCLIQNVISQTASIVMTINPTSKKISVGGTAVVTCVVNNASPDGSLLWFRSQGDLTYKIGANNVVTMDNTEAMTQRYSLGTVPSSGNSFAYNLTLTGAKPADSATIKCTTDASTTASSSLIVCLDTTSQICDCMVSKGWASPECYPVSTENSILQTSNESRSAMIGLLVALGVTLAYVAVMGFIRTENVLRRCCRNEYEKDLLLRRSDPASVVLGKAEYDDSDCAQLDPSDSSSDTATNSTSDPSSNSSDTPNASNARRIQPEIQETQRSRWNPNAAAAVSQMPQSPNKVAIRPEIHDNRAYEGDEDDEWMKREMKNDDVMSIVSHRSKVSSFGDVGRSLESLSQHDQHNMKKKKLAHEMSKISMISSGSVDIDEDQSHRAQNKSFELSPSYTATDI